VASARQPLRLAQAEAPGRPETATPSGAAAPAGRKGLLSGEAGGPLSIKADELEAVEEGGLRRLRFTRSVHVEQGELSVHADRLEAFYPKDAEQPDRLVASGHVRVRRLDRQLACDAATYYRAEERLVCTGHAELREGEDRVRGDQIEIFFEQNRVRVSGGAVVHVTPERKRTEDEPGPVGTGPAAAGAEGGR
jgi:lipopolysaccharide export system protein LptA